MPPLKAGSSSQTQNLNHKALIEQLQEFQGLSRYERMSRIRHMNRQFKESTGETSTFTSQALIELLTKLENLERGRPKLTAGDKEKLLLLQRHWGIQDVYEKAPVTELLTTSADAAVALTRGAARFMTSPTDLLSANFSLPDGSSNSLNQERLMQIHQLLNLLMSGNRRVTGVTAEKLGKLTSRRAMLLSPVPRGQENRQSVIRILQINFLQEGTQATEIEQAQARAVIAWLRSFKRVPGIAIERYHSVSESAPLAEGQQAVKLAPSVEWISEKTSADRDRAVDEGPDVRASRSRSGVLRNAAASAGIALVPEPMASVSEPYLRPPLGVSDPSQITDLQLERVEEAYLALVDLEDLLQSAGVKDPLVKEVRIYIDALESWDLVYQEGMASGLPRELMEAEVLLPIWKKSNLVEEAEKSSLDSSARNSGIISEAPVVSGEGEEASERKSERSRSDRADIAGRTRGSRVSGKEKSSAKKSGVKSKTSSKKSKPGPKGLK